MRAAKGAATARAKNGPVREELRAALLAPVLTFSVLVGLWCSSGWVLVRGNQISRNAQLVR